MSAYCPGCLDTWHIAADRIARGDFVNIAPGTRMHVACGRALEAIRTSPPTVVAEREPYADERWAA
jgi:hypothetical protein